MSNLLCPECGSPNIFAKPTRGCHEGDNCTHICPDCAWHFEDTDDTTGDKEQ